MDVLHWRITHLHHNPAGALDANLLVQAADLSDEALVNAARESLLRLAGADLVLSLQGTGESSAELG